MNNSNSFTQRMIAALSYLSANCPEVADSNKNGKMNKPAIKLLAKAGAKPP